MTAGRNDAGGKSSTALVLTLFAVGRERYGIAIAGGGRVDEDDVLSVEVMQHVRATGFQRGA
jgi:hypothetical protein